MERLRVDDAEEGLQRVDALEERERNAKTALGGGQRRDLIGCLLGKRRPIKFDLRFLRHAEQICIEF